MFIAECSSPTAVTASKPALRIRSAATSSPAIASTSATAIECAAAACRSPSSSSVVRTSSTDARASSNSPFIARSRPTAPIADVRTYVEVEASRISVARAMASSTGRVPRCSVMQIQPIT